MAQKFRSAGKSGQGWWFARVEVLVFLPSVSLVALWLGGENAVIATALLCPVIVALMSMRSHGAVMIDEPSDLAGGFASEVRALKVLDQILADQPVTGLTTACFVIVFDEIDRFAGRHGQHVTDRMIYRVGERLGAVLRGGDMVARLAGDVPAYAVILSPIRRFDLETAVQLSSRLQACISAAMVEGELTLHPSVSIGFCLAERSPAPLGRSILDAARIAADEALHHGPSAIRAFQPDLTRRRADRAELRAGIQKALDEGEVMAWFQPQVCTDTGAVSGFEALARWVHPQKGVISPAEFLPVIDDAGLSERLVEVILYQSLSALVRWDKAGLSVPRVAVNFSENDLRNPSLCEKLKWDLDRFGIEPHRLTIEVLESVAVRSDDDVVVSNLAGLSKMGCHIDLDDFGTGLLCLANLRRYSIQRIKIDRSFIHRVDDDPMQKQMVAGIVSLAEQLGLETLAEGVETPAEHATVAQLGCGHVQGFGIGRPMAFDETLPWIARHEAARIKPLGLTRRSK